tara:strand:- start:5294 stop:6301 length:1008 start_codon:yes stop_codon:yes gene_type:complete
MKILLTGAAGFIGYHLAQALLSRNDNVMGVDNLNDYYDVDLKKSRLDEISRHKNFLNFKFIKADISDRSFMKSLFDNNKFDVVVNLAAQAGVRYSLDNPHAYVDSNIVGFVNLLEGCKSSNIKHLVYASSSSVYGMNKKQPFSTDDIVDFPISLYAATKKSNEIIAHSYSHLYKIPMTGLRFFTVYGSYGRPDMAYFKFTKAILEGNPIDVFNNGNMKRDFTFIDDIVDGIIRTIDRPPLKQNNQLSLTDAPFKIYNIGNNKPITLNEFIKGIEDVCGVKARKNFHPMQPGDVPITYADIDDFDKEIGFRPNTPIYTGLKSFYDWYRKYYSLNKS